MENALRTATGGSRRTALRPELPSWLASIRRAKAAAWEALPRLDRADSDFRRVSALEVGFYLRDQLLRDADVFSSANSVELRVPFLDLDVLHEAWRIPSRLHTGPLGGRKWVLKAVLHRLEPAHPVRRAKMGFVFPWVEWLWRTELDAPAVAPERASA